MLALHSLFMIFFAKIAKIATMKAEEKKWKRRVSIPVPRACEARALPIELRSRCSAAENYGSYNHLSPVMPVFKVAA